jgi:hypothetical protein
VGDLKQRIEETKKQILDAQAKLRSLELQLLEEKTGFKRGELVMNREGKTGILEYGKYTSFWYWRKIKKDGTASSQATYLGTYPVRIE